MDSVNNQTSVNHQSSNARNFAMYSFFFGGVTLTSILSGRAMIAQQTSLKVGVLTLGALASTIASLAASYTCNDPDTTDVKSFSNNFKRLFCPIKTEVLEHVSIPEVSLWRVIDRVRTSVQHCSRFALGKFGPKE